MERLAGARLIDIASALNANGTPTPAGRPVWLPIHVSRLLRTKGARERSEALAIRRTGIAASRGD